MSERISHECFHQETRNVMTRSVGIPVGEGESA